MPLSKFREVPYIAQQDLYEYLQSMHNLISGIGGMGGELDDDNLSDVIPNRTDTEEITGLWTFEGPLTINSGANITGDVNLTGALNLIGNLSIIGDANITGDLTLIGILTADQIEFDYNEFIRWGGIETLTHDGAFFIFNDALKVSGALWATYYASFGTIGFQTTYPAMVSAEGTVQTLAEMIAIENRGNAVNMDGTQTGIIWRQYYYDATLPSAIQSGRILIGTETDWTSTSSTQDSYMAFATALDGSLVERLRIDSIGASTMTGIGTVKNNFNILSLTNTVFGADMDLTETSIQFNQKYLGAVTNEIVNAGRISIGTETDWTDDVNTQDSYMKFLVALNGSLGVAVHIDSAKNLRCYGSLRADTAFNINGVVGFSGTVTPVTSITVVGGIVTACS